jgi:hypothetical protein
MPKFTPDQLLRLRDSNPEKYLNLAADFYENEVKLPFNRLLKPVKKYADAIKKATGQGTPIRDAKLFFLSYLVKKRPDDVADTYFFEVNAGDESTRETKKKQFFKKIEDFQSSVLYDSEEDLREDPWIMEFDNEFYRIKTDAYWQQVVTILSEIAVYYYSEGENFISLISDDFTEYLNEKVKSPEGEMVPRAVFFLNYKLRGRTGKTARGTDKSKVLGFTREDTYKIANITIDNAKDMLKKMKLEDMEYISLDEYISANEKFFIRAFYGGLIRIFIHEISTDPEDTGYQVEDTGPEGTGYQFKKLVKAAQTIEKVIDRVRTVKKMEKVITFLEGLEKPYKELEKRYYESLTEILSENHVYILQPAWDMIKKSLIKEYSIYEKEMEEKNALNKPKPQPKPAPEPKQGKRTKFDIDDLLSGPIEFTDEIPDMSSFMIDEKYSRKIEPDWRRTKYLGPDNEKIQLFPNGLDDMSFTGKRGSYDLDYEDSSSYIRDDEDEDGGDFAYNENEETDGFDMERLSRYSRIRPRDHQEDYYDPFENDQLDPFMSMPDDEDIDIDMDYEYEDYDTIDDEMDGSEFYEDDDIEDEYIEDEPFVDSYNTKLTNKEVNRLMLENYRNRLQYNSSMEQRYRYGW